MSKLHNIKTSSFLIILFLDSILASSLLKPQQEQQLQTPNQTEPLLPEDYRTTAAKEIQTYYFDPEKDCDLITTNPLCINNGNRVLLPVSKVPHLLAHYEFDSQFAIDSSGNKNHAYGKVYPGPSFGGVGSSALFSKGNYLKTPKIKLNDAFTITFLMYILDKKNKLQTNSSHCTILQRGNEDKTSNEFYRSPVINYNVNTGKLEIGLTTEDKKEGEFLISKSVLNNNYWYHIAIIVDKDIVSLYINGIEDKKIKLSSKLIIKNDKINSAFYIGNTPWTNYKCINSFVIDELKIYDDIIDVDFIQGEASPILGTLEPNYVQIGCLNCTLSEADNACFNKEGYRLCTSIELHSGVYQIAKGLGIVNEDDLIWTHAHLLEKKDEENKEEGEIRGLGMCCVLLN